MRPILLLPAILLVALALYPPRPLAAQSDPASDGFSDEEAAKLLRQVAEGLQDHSARKMLGAFDLSRMEAGPIFKEQVTAFFNEYDPIRVHFKLEEVQGNTATVDAEIDYSPRDQNIPGKHKSMELRFVGAKTASGWKFVDVQPRNFFS